MDSDPKEKKTVNDPNTSAERADAPQPDPGASEQAQPSTAETELDAYRRMVADIAAAGDGRVIMNRTAEHAAVVIENVFRHAKGSVEILTGHLYDGIYGVPQVLDAVDKFLSPDPSRRVCVVAEKPIDPNHPFFAAIKKHRPDFNVKLITSELEKATPFHFCVADELNFRFEPDKTKYAAHGRFGVPEIGKKLSQTFQRLYDASREQ